MEIVYYKSQRGNFGDDLNPWLWKKIFGDYVNSNISFLGIGSILSNDNNMIKSLKGSNTKIVFGTGIRPSNTYPFFNYDSSYNIRFLRGPLSVASLGHKFKYISDAAYAVRALSWFDGIKNTPKKYKVSFMPYFKSTSFVDWKSICDKLGYHYISPFSENGVEFTMLEIASSEKLITEAMHGAILADAFRVPWHRVIFSTPHTEGEKVSEFKWNDWLFSINIFFPDSTFIPLYRKTKLNALIKKITFNTIDVSFNIPFLVKSDVNLKLQNVSNYYLSSDEVIDKIDRDFKHELTLLNNYFK